MGHGGMSYRLKAARLFLILLNVMFFLIGAALLGESVDLLITRRFQNFPGFITNENMQTNKLLLNETLYVIIIIPGFILLSIGFFGCSGAITQIQCLLLSYFWLIGILLVFQTIVIISWIVFRVELTKLVIVTIQSSIHDTYQGPLEKNPPLASFLWDLIMYYFRCCGIESKDDFNYAYKWNRTNPWWSSSMSFENRNFTYPLTCCPVNNNKKSFQEVISCALNGNDIYEIGCYQRILEVFYANRGIALFIVLCIMIMEILALTFVLVVFNRNRLRSINHVMEELPPAYRSRTRINNANLYFRI